MNADTKTLVIETIEDRFNLKSHTAGSVAEALIAGKPVFAVDTAASGNDDLVIMDDEDIVKATFCWHFDLDEFPKEWSVQQVLIEDIIDGEWETTERECPLCGGHPLSEAGHGGSSPSACWCEARTRPDAVFVPDADED